MSEKSYPKTSSKHLRLVLRFVVLPIAAVLLAFPLLDFASGKLLFKSQRIRFENALPRYLTTSKENIEHPDELEPPEDALRLLTVNVISIRPFRPPLVGHGVYLGHGKVLTANHVLGRLAEFFTTDVIVAGQRLPARVVKKGSMQTADLAVLSIDDANLSTVVSLRRTPVCTQESKPGDEAIVAYPDRLSFTRTLGLDKFGEPGAAGAFLLERVEDSGAGVFAARGKCLLGIVSRKVFVVRKAADQAGQSRPPETLAGVYVGVDQVRAFLSGL